MHFYELPLVFALVGLALYTVLAGADFGAGVWQVAAGRGPRGERLRDHAHHAMAPVWEANHVWLIFVLTVVWTAYPEAFGSIASTLSVPLFIAAIGIILRGAAYALRAGTTAPRELRLIDTVSGVSSILTPFTLGAAIGGLASHRVPVGNAAGQLLSRWLTPTSILVATLTVAAASHDVLVAVVVSVIAGAVILFPSLALLFRLLLRGQFDVADTSGAPVVSRSAIVSSLVPGLAARVAVACLVAGIGLLTVADAG